MNIFVTDPSPTASAQALPDKHVVKMPLETCQMLSIVCSEKWGHGYGKLHKKDGSAYFTEKGAYIASKPWASSNYLRDPSRKPDWLS